MPFVLRGIVYFVLLTAIAASPSFALGPDDHSVLVIVLDGLRPDYVTAESMPNLHALGERGVVGTKHHAVFPTVTRVNAATFATGAYPKTHGLMGNAILIPEVSTTRGINTSDARNLFEVDEATGGALLTAPTTGEIIQAAGGRVLVVSSGSSGSAFLLNPRVAGGAIINTDLVLPESLQPRVDELLGPKPREAYPNSARNRRAVDAYLKIGLDEIRPVLTYMWLSDPDKTGHAKGIGSPETEQALRAVDVEIGRIVTEHDRRGMSERVDIIVTSDHGFSTHLGGPDVSATLVRTGVKKSISSADVVVVHGAVYVDNHDPEVIQRAVLALQQTKGVGSIFTRGNGDATSGAIPGTFSLSSMHWTHTRAADIYVTADWDDESNEYGWKGRTTQRGVAGHGTSSPYDIHNTLIAFGPSFKRGVVSEIPSGNVDIAPTALSLLGIDPADTIDGRVLHELVVDGPGPATIEVQTKVHSVETSNNYRAELSESRVGEYRYLDWTRVTRIKDEDVTAP